MSFCIAILLQLLLEASVPPSCLDQHGWSARDYAYYNGHLECGDLLPSPPMAPSPSPPSGSISKMNIEDATALEHIVVGASAPSELSRSSTDSDSKDASGSTCKVGHFHTHANTHIRKHWP